MANDDVTVTYEVKLVYHGEPARDIGDCELDVPLPVDLEAIVIQGLDRDNYSAPDSVQVKEI